MFPRMGDDRAHHFAHFAAFGHSGESQIHAAAKERVAQVIRDWKNGKCVAPRVESRLCDASELFSMDPAKYEVRIEWPFGENRRADAMIFQDSKPLLGVEVLQSHVVEQDKANDYDMAEISWIEVRAESILANPLIWKDIRTALKEESHKNATKEIQESPRILLVKRTLARQPIQSPSSSEQDPMWLRIVKGFAWGIGAVAVLAAMNSLFPENKPGGKRKGYRFR